MPPEIPHHDAGDIERKLSITVRDDRYTQLIKQLELFYRPESEV